MCHCCNLLLGLAMEILNVFPHYFGKLSVLSRGSLFICVINAAESVFFNTAQIKHCVIARAVSLYLNHTSYKVKVFHIIPNIDQI